MVKITLADYDSEKLIYLKDTFVVHCIDGCLYGDTMNYLSIYYNSDEEAWGYEDRYWSKLTVEFVPILSEELID